MKNKVLLFTDPGIDDALAISFALSHPQIEVSGIVSSYGNHHVAQTHANLYKLVDIIKKDVPIFLGAEKPLVATYQVYGLHGKDGFANLGPRRDNYFITKYQELIKNNQNNEIEKFIKNLNLSKTTIISISPLTTIARLVDKGFLKDIKEILIMGGCIYFPGNANNLQEGNFFYDPLAVDKVLNKMSSKVILFPLNITHQLLVKRQQLNQLSKKNKKTVFLKRLLDFYINSYKMRGRVFLSPLLKRNEWEVKEYPGAPLHDLTPILYLLNRKKFVLEKIPLKVIKDGETAGSIYYRQENGYITQVALKMQYENYWQEIVKVINEK